MKTQLNSAWKNFHEDFLSARKNKRGMQQLSAIAVGVGAFAIALITVVLIAVILAQLQTSNGVSCANVSAGNCNSAYTITNNTLTMLLNFSQQLGLAGTVMGFVVIFGGLAYLGVFVYQHVRDR